MEAHDLIEVAKFCSCHKISREYVIELHENGLVEIISKKETQYLKEADLPRLEQILLFQQEMDINLPGVEVILRLLDRMEQMQFEMTEMKNRLYQFESNR